MKLNNKLEGSIKPAPGGINVRDILHDHKTFVDVDGECSGLFRVMGAVAVVLVYDLFVDISAIRSLCYRSRCTMTVIYKFTAMRLR